MTTAIADDYLIHTYKESLIDILGHICGIIGPVCDSRPLASLAHQNNQTRPLAPATGLNETSPSSLVQNRLWGPVLQLKSIGLDSRLQGFVDSCRTFEESIFPDNTLRNVDETPRLSPENRQRNLAQMCQIASSAQDAKMQTQEQAALIKQRVIYLFRLLQLGDLIRALYPQAQGNEIKHKIRMAVEANPDLHGYEDLLYHGAAISWFCDIWGAGSLFLLHGLFTESL